MSSIKSKIIAAVVTIMVIAAILFFTGCTSGSSALSNLYSEPKDSFLVQASYYGDLVILYDTETKVMYAQSERYGGITMLCNADGMPKLYEGE